MRRSACLIVLGLLLAWQSGCLLMESAKEFGRHTKRQFTFRPGDYRDLTEEEADDWVGEVGREGRGDRPMEKDPDQWWRTFMMSEKARSIERNVGIE
jgi:hypothetical protein